MSSPIFSVGATKSESETSWRASSSARPWLGIVSCVIAGVILALILVVIATISRSAPQSRINTVFWLVALFGTGAGAGLGLAGATQKRASKMAAVTGLLLNLAVFSAVSFLVLFSPPPQQTDVRSQNDASPKR